jgi:hypothetical protein
MQVGEVAASAAGDQDFLADALCALQHSHAPSAPARLHGAHQAGCAAAKNNHVITLHSERINS